MKRFLSWLALDHRSLGHQRLFKVAIGLPILLFIYFGWFCWKGHSLQWDSAGFDNFIKISKFPLTLLALILPFTALVTSWHRSIQTAEQIKRTDIQISETQRKSNFDIYLAHKKYFLESIPQGISSNPEILYSYLYHGSGPFSPSLKISIEKIEKIIKIIEIKEIIFSSIYNLSIEIISIEKNTYLANEIISINKEIDNSSNDYDEILKKTEQKNIKKTAIIIEKILNKTKKYNTLIESKHLDLIILEKIKTAPGREDAKALYSHTQHQISRNNTKIENLLKALQGMHPEESIIKTAISTHRKLTSITNKDVDWQHIWHSLKE